MGKKETLMSIDDANKELAETENLPSIEDANNELKKKSEPEQTSETPTSNGTTDGQLTSEMLGFAPPSTSKTEQKTKVDKNTHLPTPYKFEWQPSKQKEITPSVTNLPVSVSGQKVEERATQETSFEKKQKQEQLWAESPVGNIVGETVEKPDDAIIALSEKVFPQGGTGVHTLQEFLKVLRAENPQTYIENIDKLSDENINEDLRYGIWKQALDWDKRRVTNDQLILKARGQDQVADVYMEKRDKLSQIEEEYKPVVERYDFLSQSLEVLKTEIDESTDDYRKNDLIAQYNTGLQEMQELDPKYQEFVQKRKPAYDEVNSFAEMNKDALQNWGVMVEDAQKLDEEEKGALKLFPDKYAEELKKENFKKFSEIKLAAGISLTGLPAAFEEVVNETGKGIWNTVVDAGVGMIKFVEDISTMPYEQLTGSYYTWADKGVDNIVDFTDDFMKFSTLDKPFFNPKTGEVDGMAVVPILGKTIADMAILLYGANKFAAPFKAAGMGAGAAGNAGLIASSMLQTYDDYKQVAEDNGYSEGQQVMFGLGASSLAAGLETIAPNKIMRGLTLETKALSKAFTEITKKGGWKAAVKELGKVTLKELPPEMTQEILQGYGDKLAGYLSNKANKSETTGEMEEDMSYEEFVETITMTAAATFLMSGGGNFINKDAVKKESVFIAASNYEKFSKLMNENIRDNKISSIDGKKIIEEVRKATLVYGQMPKTLSQEQKQEVFPLLSKKMALVEEMGNSDKAFAEGFKTQIEVIDNKIKTILGEKKSEPKKTEEKPVKKEEKVPEPVATEEKVEVPVVAPAVVEEVKVEEPVETEPVSEESVVDITAAQVRSGEVSGIYSQASAERESLMKDWETKTPEERKQSISSIEKKYDQIIEVSKKDVSEALGDIPHEFKVVRGSWEGKIEPSLKVVIPADVPVQKIQQKMVDFAEKHSQDAFFVTKKVPIQHGRVKGLSVVNKTGPSGGTYVPEILISTPNLSEEDAYKVEEVLRKEGIRGFSVDKENGEISVIFIDDDIIGGKDVSEEEIQKRYGEHIERIERAVLGLHSGGLFHGFEESARESWGSFADNAFTEEKTRSYAGVRSNFSKEESGKENVGDKEKTDGKRTDRDTEVQPEDVQHGTREDVDEKTSEEERGAEGTGEVKLPPPKGEEEFPPLKGDEKSLLNRIYKSKKVTGDTKKKLEKFGLSYSIFTNEESSQIADAILEEVGIDRAVVMASDMSNELRGAVRTMLYAKVIDHYFSEEQKATTEEKKEKFAALQGEIANLLDEYARDSGQSIQAISHFYRISPLAIVMKITNQIEKINEEELTKKWGILGSKQSWKEKISTLKEKLSKEPKIKKRSGGKKNVFSMTEGERNDRIAELKEKWKNKKGPGLTSGGLDPEAIEIAGELGLHYVLKGAITFSKWSKKMMADLGITEQQAKEVWEKTKVPEDDKGRSIKDYVAQELMEEIRAQHMAELEKMFPESRIEKNNPKARAARKKEFEKILNGIDALKNEEGEIVDVDNFEKLFYSRLGLVDPNIPEIRAKLQAFAKKIGESEPGLFRDRATIEMLDYINNLKRENRLTLGYPIIYANMLYGYETHLRNMQWNLGSAMLFHMGLLTLRNPRFAGTLWKSFFKGLKRGSVEAREIFATGYDKTGAPVIERDLIERMEKEGFLKVLWHYTVPFRALRASDALFNMAVSEAKTAQMFIKEALLLNSTLPPHEQKSRKQIVAEVNDLMYDTEGRKAQAERQAEKETEKFYNLEDIFIDGKHNPKYASAQYNPMYRNFKRRVYEIMEQSRPLDIVTDAKDWADRALLIGKPKGYLGALAAGLNTLFGAMPAVKMFTMPFVNVPMNIANFMIDWSPLGFISAIHGKEGALIPEQWKKKHGIQAELTPDQKKELMIKATVSTTGMAVIWLLTQFKYRDDEGEERPLLVVYADGVGDYAKNEELKRAGTGFEPYTLDFAGVRMSYKSSPLVAWFASVGYFQDYERFKGGSEKSMAKKIAVASLGHLTMVGEQANLSGLKDLLNFGDQAGAFADDEDRISKMIVNVQKGAFKMLKNLVVPNYISQANNDVRGIMDLNDKRAMDPWEVLVKDVPIVDQILRNRVDHFGRPVKDEFDMPFYPKGPRPADKFYQLIFEKEYQGKLKFYNDKAIFLGDEESEVTRQQVDDINKIRGKYVLDALEDPKKHTDLGGKTTFEYLKSLDKAEFETAMGYLFSQGTWEGKDKIFGQGVWAEREREEKPKDESTEKRKFRKFKRMYEYEEGVEFRKKEKKK